MRYYQENKHLDKFTSAFEPIIYKLYVDNAFIILRTNYHISLFLEFLMKQHLFIMFTYADGRRGV